MFGKCFVPLSTETKVHGCLNKAEQPVPLDELEMKVLLDKKCEKIVK